MASAIEMFRPTLPATWPPSGGMRSMASLMRVLSVVKVCSAPAKLAVEVTMRKSSRDVCDSVNSERDRRQRIKLSGVMLYGSTTIATNLAVEGAVSDDALREERELEAPDEKKSIACGFPSSASSK